MAQSLSYVTRPWRERRNEPTGESACSYRSHALVWPLALAMVLTGGAWAALIQAEEIENESDVILVIKDQAFHVVKGKALNNTSHPSFSLSPGAVIVELRNEDPVAHQFVSPLFNRVEFQFSGKATLVYAHTATGIRLDPKDTVILRFELPERSTGLFKFWCNVHGKIHGDVMRGEILVLKSEQGLSQ